MKRFNSQRIASIGILSALSVVISFGHFPIFPPPVNFLELDFADIPIFIATFLYGPIDGLFITAVVSLIGGLTSMGGPLGMLMHFFATGSYVLVAGLIYKKLHTFKGAIIGMVGGTITWVLVMIPFNLLITPLFMNQPVQAVIGILPFIVAFNFIKAIVNSVCTLLVYKYTHKLINKIFPEHQLFASSKKNNEEVKQDNVTCENDANNTANESNEEIK